MSERPDVATDAAASRTGAGSAGVGELVNRATQQVSDLVRAEMQLARAELREAAKHAGKGAGLFGTAGILAFYGGAVLVATAVLALALVLDAWLAALIVGVALLAAAGVAAMLGKGQVQQAPPPVQHSIDSVRTDVETVKERGRS